jgi:hypothetical protein
MSVTVAGKLITGDGIALADTTIRFKADANSNIGTAEIINRTTFTTVTDASGNYSVSVQNGAYIISVLFGTTEITLGGCVINAETPSPIDLLELTEAEGVNQSTAQAILDQAIAAKNEAEAIKDAAEISVGSLVDQAEAARDAALATEHYLMTESEFQALAARRREQYAASGFVEVSGGDVNEGIQSVTNASNQMTIKEALKQVNGISTRIHETIIDLPDSSTVEHADSTNSGLVKNGDFSLGDNGDWAKNSGIASISVGGFTSTGVGLVWHSTVVETGKKYIIEFKGSIDTGTLSFRHSFGSYDIATPPNFVQYLASAESTRVEVTATSDILSIGFVVLEQSTANNLSISVIEAASLSRQDLVFLESWDEDISEKGNIVYPYGNVQYRGGDVDGLSGIANGSFTGADTYSLFGNWQTAGDLVGKGYDWDLLSDTQKAIFAGNPENNLRKDGDRILQTQYKIRVEQGLDDSPSITDYGYVQVDTDKGLYYNATTGKYAIEIAAVSRNNNGIMHPVFNQFGTAKTTDSKFWYDTATTIASTIDCFNPSRVGGTIASGVSGAPDGGYSDAIYSNSIIDLRNSAHEKPKAELLEDIKRSLISGEKRSDFDGDGVWETTFEGSRTLTAFNVADGNSYFNGFNFNLDRTESRNIGFGIRKSDGKIAYIFKYTNAASLFWSSSSKFDYDGVFPWTSNDVIDIYFYRKSTHKQSGQKLHCDILANPSNYGSWADALANGYTLQGTPLLVSEEGASMLPDGTTTTFKLSNKATAVQQVLKSTDSGATWATASYTLNSTANTITFSTAPAVDDLIMVNYTTTDNPTYPAVNSECLEIGDVLGIAKHNVGISTLVKNVIGKVSTSTSFPQVTNTNVINYTFDDADFSGSTPDGGLVSNLPVTHNPVNLLQADVAVKALFTLSQENGRYVCDVKFKEMKWDTGNDAWSDTGSLTAVNGTTMTQYNIYKVTQSGSAMEGRLVYILAPSVQINDWAVLSVIDGKIVTDSGVTYTTMRLWDGNGWGDDNKIDIVDNVTTTTDDNGNTVLIGNKRVKTNCFVKEK